MSDISSNYKEKSSAEDFLQHQLLTQSEVAKYLGLSTEEVQNLGQESNDKSPEARLMPFKKIDDKYYYSKILIDEWLQIQETTNVQ